MTDTGQAIAETVFEQLGDTVKAALSTREFTTPTDPQQQAIPAIAAGEHVLVISPTGSGKTETAMLPIFDAIIEHRERVVAVNDAEPMGISALYITPLRALNRDMRDRLEWWGETLKLDIDVRHGDTGQYRRRQQATDPPDVLVTTPETLQAMLTGSRLRNALSDVNHVVVDEVHELANSKRGVQLAIGLERLVEVAGSFQRIGLSATVGVPETVGEFLTGNRGCHICEIDRGSRLDVQVLCPEITKEDQKLARSLLTEPEFASHVRAIAEIVDEHESTLVFVNTRQTAEALGSRFKTMGANIGVHHGSLSKEARIEMEDNFKSGTLDALLCTSSMELGIDIGHIDHVVQYQSPREVSRLLQRVGRAGHRINETSTGTIVATRPDDILESLVIIERARTGQVEPAEVHVGSLDTLANQIVGMVMDEGTVSGARAYEIASRSAPFATLDRESVKSVIRELARNGIVWLDEEGDRISKTGNTWQYFYANLSMIPDESSFLVYNMASGRGIGTLDERFVVNFAAPGEVFVQRGEMWRIVEIDEDRERINVTPIEDPGGEIPTWVGQEIPVPFDVAESVGKLRDKISIQLENGTTPTEITNNVRDTYSTDVHTIERGISQIRHQIESKFQIPTHQQIVIESGHGTVIMNACVGHKVNETLGRMLSALLGQRTGSSIGLDTDPYRIELTVPRSISASDVTQLLYGTDPDHVEPIIELSLKRSDVLKFKLSQVAVKFGAFKRWNSSSTGYPVGRLLPALDGTPMYTEAVREVFHEELAIDRTTQLLESIQTGEIEIVQTGSLTPVGLSGRSSSKELLSPENADSSVIQTVKERIQNDRILLVCLHCRKWNHKTLVKRVLDQPRCPICDSTRIAALNPWASDVITAIKATDKNDDQERATKRAYRAANLVQTHGKHAVIALAARGVGPHNATRIIGKLRENEDDFYRDVLVEERRYARTKAFWD